MTMREWCVKKQCNNQPAQQEDKRAVQQEDNERQ